MDTRIFFSSFPRSGSVWYLEMLGASIGATKKEMVHERTIKMHNVLHSDPKWFSYKDRVFYMYRHPKDAFWSYARYKYMDKTVREIKAREGIDKIPEGRTYAIRTGFDEAVLKAMLFEPYYREPLLPIPWWIQLMEYYMSKELEIKVPVCYLKYEDVLVDPIYWVKRGLEFLGYDVEPKVEKYLTSPLMRERLMIHTHKHKMSPLWTKDIDDRVNKGLGDYPKKYGYEE